LWQSPNKIEGSGRKRFVSRFIIDVEAQLIQTGQIPQNSMIAHSHIATQIGEGIYKCINHPSKINLVNLVAVCQI
jgi:hypothetical protein